MGILETQQQKHDGNREYLKSLIKCITKTKDRAMPSRQILAKACYHH